MIDKNKKDWRDFQLEDEEIKLLESIENGEWQSIENIEERRQNLSESFSDNLKHPKIKNKEIL